MKNCLRRLFDALVFTNRMRRFLAHVVRGTGRLSVYKICYCPEYAKALEPMYSLVEYDLQTRREKYLVQGVSFEHSVLTCAVLTSDDYMIIVDPDIASKKSGYGPVMTGTSHFLGTFSFIDQSEKPSVWRFLKELSAYPILAVRNIYVMLTLLVCRK